MSRGWFMVSGAQQAKPASAPAPGILAKRRDTSLPLSLNHLLNRLCAFTSISCACGNLRMHGLQSFLGALWVHVQSTPYHT